jgi:hypothetical protein
MKMRNDFFCISRFTGQITEDDERLLEEETASPANLKRYKEIKEKRFVYFYWILIIFRSLLNKRSVPWLRKTEYISTEQSSIKSTLKLGEVRYC